MIKLNLGSGKYLLKDFVNIDKIEYPGVKSLDLRDGLPYNDNSIDEIFAAHFIEHLDINGAILILKEGYRVLKHSKLITIIIPDFQKILKQFDFIEANKIIFSNEGIGVGILGVSSDSHRSFWDTDNLVSELKKVGFQKVYSAQDSPYMVVSIERMPWQTIIKAEK